MRLTLFRIGICLLVPSIPSFSLAATISTAVGNGADVEMREPGNDRLNGTSMNTRTSGAGDRNEIIGLRFDLSGYVPAQVSNVSLTLISYRTNDQVRQVHVYGVTEGATSGTGKFNTATWSEEGLEEFGDLPGLEVTDGDFLTQSINSNSVTFLGALTFPVTPEGGTLVFTNAALTSFVQSHTGKLVMLLLAAGNTSSGQSRFATREATATATGVLTGSGGAFAPRLDFAGEGIVDGGLRFTNIWLTEDGIVAAGEGGTSLGDYAILSAPDLTVPAASWAALATNSFDAAGSFVFTNPVQFNEGARFFRVLEVDRPINFDHVGFAGVAGTLTGGAGGPTQTVSSSAQFISAVTATGPRVVQVSGQIDLNGSGTGSVNIQSDKTIVGLGTNATVLGQLQISGRSNVIIRNLIISNNGEAESLDGVRIVNGSHHIWVDHCTFVDCGDGELDNTVGADYITISWCKFYYTRDNGHNFVNLIAASDFDSGNYRITFHHNWYSTMCRQRMPMSRYGTVHLFNNFYNSPGNGYCSNARTNAQFLSEHNVYRDVRDPIFKESNGRIRTVGNLYQNCTGRIDPGTDVLDPILTPPPYPYNLDPADLVPFIVTNNAGAGKGPFAP
ncbi:MAG TPA: hypothetical protein GYA07_01250 [Verrucomicrobia bacterium]|nr:hypothetical protein [Verrucomicrobiota bacterium]